MNLKFYDLYIKNKGNIMKKLIISGLLLFSLNSLHASEADRIMNRYIPYNERNELINRDYIEQRNNRLNNAIKCVYLAKMDKSYDISWCSYLKSYFIETPDNRVIFNINQVEQQLRNQLNVLHNNTWEQWGWAAARYSAVILATVVIVKTSEHCSLLPSFSSTKEFAPVVAATVVETTKEVTTETVKEIATETAKSIPVVMKTIAEKIIAIAKKF
jgi:hypothetical protein